MTKQSGIVRRPDFAVGGLTEEEREKMAAHAELWIKRAFRTEPANPQLIDKAIKGLYHVAKLTEPRVIVVPSPLVMAMAGGIASVWWHLFENKLFGKKREAVTEAATEAATRAATDSATEVATYAATIAATENAIEDATDAATRLATKAATYDVSYAATEAATRRATSYAIHTATYRATGAVTDDATDDARYAATIAATDGASTSATDDATAAATRTATAESWLTLAASFVGEEWALAALNSTHRWVSVYQSGNMWAPFDCCFTACRDILGLRLPAHEAYAHWEQAAIEGGFRWMHPKFCLVSDFPEVLRVNAQNLPHAELGPSHRWRDGFSIWHLNGVNVEQWMAESHPDDMDSRKVLRIRNIDQRRECIRRMGMERIVLQLNPKVLDVERREVGGEYRLLAVNMNYGEPWRFLQMINQSIDVVHIEAVPRECSTVRQALNWRRSQNINHDWFPVALT